MNDDFLCRTHNEYWIDWAREVRPCESSRRIQNSCLFAYSIIKIFLFDEGISFINYTKTILARQKKNTEKKFFEFLLRRVAMFEFRKIYRIFMTFWSFQFWFTRTVTCDCSIYFWFSANASFMFIFTLFYFPAFIYNIQYTG